MLHLIKKWYAEDDPITEDQVRTLMRVLGELDLTEKALEGFLIVAGRLVDEFGHHRTDELAAIFRTELAAGRLALLRSLEHVRDWVGGMAAYERLYPVSLDPPTPAFPQLRIMEIASFAPRLYRVMDSRACLRGSGESLQSHIQRTGRLPAVPVQTVPVLRTKPVYHWCSHGRWDTPDQALQALQILPEWGSDARLRATLNAAELDGSAFLAFNGDADPSDRGLKFYNYVFEPLAQDHPALPGGGAQIGLDGAPPVALLELWDEVGQSWQPIWQRA